MQIEYQDNFAMKHVTLFKINLILWEKIPKKLKSDKMNDSEIIQNEG